MSETRKNSHKSKIRIRKSRFKSPSRDLKKLDIPTTLSAAVPSKYSFLRSFLVE